MSSRITRNSVVRLGDWVGVAFFLGPGEAAVYQELDEGLFGGPDLQRCFDLARVAATSELGVLLEGESGTGKELFARSIHRLSGRSGPLLATNCAAHQPATAIAELFGHRKGAYTGAQEAHGGLIRQASGGTLLLDEVTDLPLEVQAQLLRVVESKELVPLGESRAVQVDVRFVAATNRPLEKAVAGGMFRADLRARLEGFRIELPALRERRGDVPLLFLHLLHSRGGRHMQPDPLLLERVCLYAWPLNVRELLAFVQRAIAASGGASTVSFDGVAAQFPRPSSSAESDPGAEPSPVRRRRFDPRSYSPGKVEAVRAAVERHSGSVAKAAAELEITRQSAYRMLRSSLR